MGENSPPFYAANPRTTFPLRCQLCTAIVSAILVAGSSAMRP